MPEVATQTEAKDTHRNVSTQCGEQKKIITVSVIAEYRALKEINAYPRKISNRKSKPALKTGMKVSEVNTDKVRKATTHRKSIGTEGWTRIKEDEEVTILKEINGIEVPRNNMQNKATGCKRPWRHTGISRQEKLYADILRGSAIEKQRKWQGRENKENAEGGRKKSMEERRRMKRKLENQEWLQKFREWSPSQEWPISEKWQRIQESVEGRQIIITNRETRLLLKF